MCDARVHSLHPVYDKECHVHFVTYTNSHIHVNGQRKEQHECHEVNTFNPSRRNSVFSNVAQCMNRPTHTAVASATTGTDAGQS